MKPRCDRACLGRALIGLARGNHEILALIRARPGRARDWSGDAPTFLAEPAGEPNFSKNPAGDTHGSPVACSRTKRHPTFDGGDEEEEEEEEVRSPASHVTHAAQVPGGESWVSAIPAAKAGCLRFPRRKLGVCDSPAHPRRLSLMPARRPAAKRGCHSPHLRFPAVDRIGKQRRRASLAVASQASCLVR